MWHYRPLCIRGHDTHVVGRDSSGRCKRCALIYSTTWRRKHPRSKLLLRGDQLKRYYKITVDQYNQMVITQDGRCLICREKAKLFVDHDHISNKIRGLLCTRCNVGLGMFRDNVTFLISAKDYLSAINSCK